MGKLLALLIFIFTCNTKAAFLVNEVAFRGFESTEITVSDSLAPHNIPSIDHRKMRQTHEFLEGLSVLLISQNPAELQIAQNHRKKLQEVIGAEPSDLLLKQLRTEYKRVEVISFSLPKDAKRNEACVDVKWQATFSGTVNFCGFFWIDQKSLVFKIDAWSMEKANFAFSRQDARLLAEVATQALLVRLSDADTQLALAEIVNQIRQTY